MIPILESMTQSRVLDSQRGKPKTKRFGFSKILESLAAIQHRGGVEMMDRQEMLALLAVELEVEEAELLQKGFDRAYRQIVEGV